MTTSRTARRTRRAALRDIQLAGAGVGEGHRATPRARRCRSALGDLLDPGQTGAHVLLQVSAPVAHAGGHPGIKVAHRAETSARSAAPGGLLPDSRAGELANPMRRAVTAPAARRPVRRRRRPAQEGRGIGRARAPLWLTPTGMIDGVAGRLPRRVPAEISMDVVSLPSGGRASGDL